MIFCSAQSSALLKVRARAERKSSSSSHQVKSHNEARLHLKSFLVKITAFPSGLKTGKYHGSSLTGNLLTSPKDNTKAGGSECNEWKKNRCGYSLHLVVSYDAKSSFSPIPKLDIKSNSPSTPDQ